MARGTVSNATIGVLVSPESLVAVKMLVGPLEAALGPSRYLRWLSPPRTDCPRAALHTSATTVSSSTWYSLRGPKGTLDAIQITRARLQAGCHPRRLTELVVVS